MRVTLRFLAGEYEGESRELTVPAGRTVMIGRAPQCDLVLGERDRTASSTHAKLWLDDRGELYITDVGSQYGTFVNDKPTVKARLRPGDRVRFGFRGPLVEIAIADDSAAPPPPRPRPRPVKRARPVAMTTVRAVPKELLEAMAKEE
ncbi:MAG: FHA domain-containing protein, partial [Planctomycetota bacterium]